MSPPSLMPTGYLLSNSYVFLDTNSVQSLYGDLSHKPNKRHSQHVRCMSHTISVSTQHEALEVFQIWGQGLGERGWL